jgi:FkbM family methyltransferase
MAYKTAFRDTIQKLSGLYLYRTPPRGVDLASDIKVALKAFRPQIVFDIGANIGQSATEYLTLFPQARIYSFEPTSGAFAKLRARHGTNPRVVLEQLALSDRAGEARMTIDAASVASQLSEAAEGEVVRLETLDGCAARHGLDRIDFVKIDTEGHDLTVLHGASGLLARQAIGMIQVEAGMNPTNGLHCRFEDLKACLEGQGYLLFALYEQAREFKTGLPILRRTNPVFLSSALAEANRAGGSRPA